MTNLEIEQATIALMTALTSGEKEVAHRIVGAISDPDDLRRFVYALAFLFRAFAGEERATSLPLFLRFVGMVVADEEVRG